MAFTLDTSVRLPAGNTTGGRSTNPGGMSYICGNNAQLLVLGIAIGAGPTPGRENTAPTYGGRAFTQVCTSANDLANSETATEMWELRSPSTGLDASILVPNAAGRTLLLWASSWNVSSGYSVTIDGSVKTVRTVTNASENIVSTDANELVLFIIGNGLANVTTANVYTTMGEQWLSATSPLDKGAYQAEMAYYIKPLQASASTGFMFGSSPTTMVTGWWKQLAQAPATPTLVSPTDNAVDISINTYLNWTPSISGPKPSSYIVQVCPSTTFITNSVSEAGVTNTYYQVSPNLTNDTSYWWRVASTNPSGNSSYPTAWRFGTIALALTSIKAVLTVVYASISKVSTVAKASISKVSGLQ